VRGSNNTACGNVSVSFRSSFSSGALSSQTSFFHLGLLAKDREAHYTLIKRGSEWILMQGIGGTDSPIRYEPKSAPPAKGQLRASAPAMAAPARETMAAGAGPVAMGHYQCVMSAGGQLITVGEFTLQNGGKYIDSDGKAGTYITNASLNTLLFHGGGMDGQTAAITEHGLQLKSRRNSVDCDRTR
jgi:hypothetical protein